jgi:NADH-ubiquinone oxidoreductase chain 2
MFASITNNIQKNKPSTFFSLEQAYKGKSLNRITIITLLFIAFLTYNTLYFQIIGKGISIYNGLFQITVQSQLVEIVLLLIASSILLSSSIYRKVEGSTQLTPEGNISRDWWYADNLNKKFINNPAFFAEPEVMSTSISTTAKAYFKYLTEIRNEFFLSNTAIYQSKLLPQITNSLDLFNKKYLLSLAGKEDQYSLIAIFSVLGGSLLMSSLDFLSMYLSIELQSFAFYILATLNKESLSSTSAGLKYFLLGSLSSCFILLGTGIIYSYTGVTHFDAMSALISLGAQGPYLPSIGDMDGDPISAAIINGMNLGFVILVIGFLFKVSAAPFYQWAPDVYDGTPTIVTVWLTIMVKLTVLIFLLSLYESTWFSNIIDVSYPGWIHDILTLESIDDLAFVLPEGSGKETLEEAIEKLTALFTDPNINIPKYIFSQEKWGIKGADTLLLLCSLLSLIIGAIGGLSQTKLKRLLAFSSISHVGFLLLALGIFTAHSIDSFVFYLIQYSLTSLNIFLIVLAFGYFSSFVPNKDRLSKDIGEAKEISNISELKGQLYNNPILSISLAICLYSMAGIPPLIGFFSKQYVLLSAIENGNYFLCIIAILMSVISASYYLKIIKIAFFDSPVSFEGQLRNANSINLLVGSYSFMNQSRVLTASNIHSYIISTLTIIILLFFMYPTLLLNATQLISLTIFNL